MAYILNDIKEIIEKVKSRIPDFDSNRFLKAYHFADHAHKGQMRYEGTPYISHLIETVKILSNLRVDENTLIAAMLHDVSEDTSYSINDIQKEFGEHVAFLVNGVTKLSKVYYKNAMEKRQIESLKKLLLHTSKDPRVIFIKLADRLHNMRTLHFVRPDKQTRIAKETLEVYIPISNLMGIQGIKYELEDLCFKHLYQKEYRAFIDRLKKYNKKHDDIAQKTITEMSAILDKKKINAKVYLRPKSIFHIFKKIKSFDDPGAKNVLDLITIRIVTDTPDDCYKALGVAHSMYKPDAGKLKDYIAVPKINGYQSIHTIVLGPKEARIEFQIRTQKMHDDSELGINLVTTKSMPEKYLKWMEQILELEKQDSDDDYFMRDLKEEVFSDRITVFNQNGEPFYLPSGSSVVDFIYATEPKKIVYAYEARINDVIMPLTMTLNSNDKVKILVTRTACEPRLEWLPYVKTGSARSRIKEIFKTKTRHEKITIGKKFLQNAFNIAGLGFIEDMRFKKIQEVFKKRLDISYDSPYDLYAAVGEGSISPFDVIQLIYLERNARGALNVGIINDSIPFSKKTVKLEITGKDRPGFVMDVTDVIRQYNVNLLSIRGAGDRSFGRKAKLIIDFEMKDLRMFTEIVKRLEQIPGCLTITRKFAGQMGVFITFAFFNIIGWALHPFIVGKFVETGISSAKTIVGASIYVGLAVIFVLSFYLKKLMERNFPGTRSASIGFGLTLFVVSFVTAMTYAEFYFYKIPLDPIVIAVLIALIIFYMFVNYIEHRKAKLPKG
ncbi:MAG: GTP pyrophosphokinase, GTP pyrophosphokinase [Candidatus Peregrinibacteria bacterium GW2011_GWC2_39_14]|nr:MAG: GTP pyrophosphokinase [Candidatus Peregrinibacteria bacterium GW2011_GWA2_38_36]KKR05028.1 MAG: GTP pyrophosphokinase, GTP pyrophosphokinase [Candidatus Peregrinibacteria bacterium GW2011_GWC2_39_14]